MRDKHQTIEEPDEVKVSRPVLKTNGVGDNLVEFNTLATLSTGVIFVNPKALKRARKTLTRLQRQLSLKVKGSNRYKKQKLRISKLHRRITNVRKDATHKVTTYISKNHAVVALEDLNTSFMLKNHKERRCCERC